MKLGKRVGLGPGHIVLDGNPAPAPQRRLALQFSAHICYRKMAGLIKVLLGMEIGLGQGDIVLDGDPAPPPPKGGRAPIFDPCPFWPNGWMDQGATWYGGRPRPRPHSARWGPSSPPPKGVTTHNLWPLSIVGKRLDGSRCHFGMEVGFGPGHMVLDGCPAPPTAKGAQSVILGTYLLWPCGQTAGWIKMSHGMEVGLCQATLC